VCAQSAKWQTYTGFKRENGGPVLPLREVIQKAIESGNGDSTKAAIAVCVALEDEIGLAGNGWFDGDDVLEDALRDR
jgi:hypothetical protein